MNHQYKLIVTNRNIYKEFIINNEVTKLMLGTTSKCDFRINPDYFFYPIELVLEKDEEVDCWQLVCNDNVYVGGNGIQKLIITQLKHGDSISLFYAETDNEVFVIRFLIDFEEKVPYINNYIEIKDSASITVGDDSRSDIVLCGDFVTNTNIQLTKQGEKLAVVEKSSPYGVYINGKIIEKKKELSDCDFMTVSNCSFYYRDEKLFFDDKNIKINNFAVYKINEDSSFSYPQFVRNTRKKINIVTDEIEVLDPSEKPNKPETNIIMTLFPSIIMLVLVVGMRGMMGGSGASYILFSAGSMGLGIVTTVMSFIQGNKGYKKAIKKREEVYKEYISKKEKSIIEFRKAETEKLQQKYSAPSDEIEKVQRFDADIFDRVPEDDDFLTIYLGSGTKKSERQVAYKPQETLEDDDELKIIPGKLYDYYQCVNDVPIVLGIKDANAIGISGTKEDNDYLFKNIVCDLVCRQYHTDVDFYLLMDNEKEYAWIKALPQINNENHYRNIVFNNQTKTNIFEYLYKEFTMRLENDGDYKHIIIFVTKDNDITSHPLSKFISNASEINVTFIFFEKSTDYLPLYCKYIIENGQGEGVLYPSEDITNKQVFKYTNISDDVMDKLTKKIAPVYCEEISLDNTLRKNISLFELLDIYVTEDLDLKSRWANSKIYESMAAPLGVDVKDDIVYLNLHEKAHGPHGLVAGTTGSGKSEILQTFILSAATLFHPYEIGFVIIDFKGGGMVNQFEKLPHLIGAITNIDGKEIDRSLKSIKAELLKRQTLFADIGVNHIDKYIKAYKSGQATVALPHLVIIVDEFAELKAEQPEFMKELISAARIGRSLGIHLILATQKPAGQVNEQIWSNSKFKLCLKVQDQADSKEVIKSPLAAEIKEPGRAYLQVGNNEIFELFQSAYSGAPAKKETESGSKAYKIYGLGAEGRNQIVFEKKNEKKGDTGVTELEAIVSYISDYCDKAQIEKLPNICLPGLPDVLPFKTCDEKNNELNISIGIYDDPDHQYQGENRISFGSGNTLIIGSSQYGKTNLLETIIRSLADTYTPKEVNMYIIDFGSMVLKNFEKLAHVGGVVCPSDDEKLKNLIKYISDQIDYRREKMLAVGVSSFIAYKEAGFTELPGIVVFIDNFTSLKELYLQDNDMLLGLLREGVSVGITFVVTNTQTNSVGYRYVANFSSKIAMFCNEPSEYSSIFASCKLKPDEKPGRCIVEINKAMYESQTYLAFEGKQEIDRVKNMQLFVQETNEKYANMRATMIPEIPALLKEDYIADNFVIADEGKIIAGLNYDTILPEIIDVQKNNMIAVSGTEESGKANYICYLVNSILRRKNNFEIILFDNYKKKLAKIDEKYENVKYEVSETNSESLIMALDAELQEEYQKLVEDEEISDKFRLLVINNEDIATSISNNLQAMNALKMVVGKYKMLNVCVIVGNVPNIPILYGAPELYRVVKEQSTIVFFDNIDNCKLADIPMSYIRQYKKKISLGDAYCISGNEVAKLKTPLVN
jgi:S-DNA-T family DNA segregation ATPase FtsK/SpoIIIE